jgi:hypothetical protein
MNHLTLFFDWDKQEFTSGYKKYVKGLSVKTERTPLSSNMERIYVINTPQIFHIMAIYSEDPSDTWFLTQIPCEEFFDRECEKTFEKSEIKEITKRHNIDFSGSKYKIINRNVYSDTDDLKYMLFKFILQ